MDLLSVCVGTAGDYLHIVVSGQLGPLVMRQIAQGGAAKAEPSLRRSLCGRTVPRSTDEAECPTDAHF